MSAQQPIGVFEITSRRPAALAMMFPWAFLALFFAPFIRPFDWRRLLWTYLAPVIPLVLLVDGIVSCLRSYRPDELLRVARSVAPVEYHWEADELAGAAGLRITYLIGWPIK